MPRVKAIFRPLTPKSRHKTPVLCRSNRLDVAVEKRLQLRFAQGTSLGCFDFTVLKQHECGNTSNTVFGGVLIGINVEFADLQSVSIFAAISSRIGAIICRDRTTRPNNRRYGLSRSTPSKPSSLVCTMLSLMNLLQNVKSQPKIVAPIFIGCLLSLAGPNPAGRMPLAYGRSACSISQRLAKYVNTPSAPARLNQQRLINHTGIQPAFVDCGHIYAYSPLT